jgi:hypothetical protein
LEVAHVILRRIEALEGALRDLRAAHAVRRTIAWYTTSATLTSQLQDKMGRSVRSVDSFKNKVMEIAKHGRVLVLPDACSGAASDGSGRAVDAAALHRMLASANVTVLTARRRRVAAWCIHPRAARCAE